MMQADTGVTAVAHVIQLAVAPVFLLSAIGAILAVLAVRLGRVVDRWRLVEAKPLDAPNISAVSTELHTLSRRARMISFSITLCTATALLICGVIAILFLGAFIHIDTSRIVATLFIAAMTAFSLGLSIFLREI